MLVPTLNSDESYYLWEGEWQAGYFPSPGYENTDDGYLEYPIVLGEEEYFVLSDTRNGGVDSRCFGPVNLDEIQGIVITLLRRNNL